MSEKCDICIPTSHRVNQLNDLLASIIAVSKEHIGSVILGITGDKKESTDYITEYMIASLRIQGVQVYVFDGSTGLMDTKTRFLGYGNEDILLIVDDDVVLTQGYLNLIHHFRDPKVGAVSGTYQSSINDHYKDWTGEPIENPNQMYINKIQSKDGLVELKDKYQVMMLKKPRVYRCEVLVGSAVFARRNLLEFDYQFNNIGYCEEYDYTYNIHSKGYDLIYDSSEMIFHNRGLSGGNRKGQTKKDKEKLAEYFMTKWKRPYSDVVVAVDFDGTIIEKLNFTTDNVKFNLIQEAKDAIQKIRSMGATLVLYTSREGIDLEDAIRFCKDNNLGFDYYNQCPSRCYSQKLDADIYIDDKSSPNGMIDWNGFINRVKYLTSERKTK